MKKLVEVSEQEIRIEFALGCKCRTNIHLKSLSPTAPVAFKIQTSAPHKFLVNPPSGLIPPLSSTTFQVVLKPQSQLPATFPRSTSDRFLLKTALAPELASDSTPSEFINSWFNSATHLTTHDIKLKVYFLGPLLLRHAVSVGDVEAARKLIKRQRSVVAELPPPEAESLYRVATQPDDTNTSSGNSDDMVGLLLEAGLKVNENAGSKGWSELHVAVAFDQTDEIQRLVTEKERGSLDCRDKEGRTPLHLAASKGQLESAKVLVSAGAQVDFQSKDGRTALHRAAANGDRRMVEMLLELGADPTISDYDLGRSANDVAGDKGHKEVVKILDRGASVLNAARRGEVEVLESLLEKGASLSFSDQYGLTPLHTAAIKGHKDAVMVLVEFGADLESRDAEGHTPLHLAVEGGSVETVQVLINRGANVNAKSKKGATPLYISKLMEYQHITQLLLHNGAAASLD
ncbi:Ankyrin repeat domain-containing protein 50 [Forsythia ovata]|uniref:Ankyrin repeat domain-containing protein 50 n=1 Tax=Forsythia ovata TaxID=205694 RepID=A0ABD1X1E3_9LAMI